MRILLVFVTKTKVKKILFSILIDRWLFTNDDISDTSTLDTLATLTVNHLTVSCLLLFWAFCGWFVDSGKEVSRDTVPYL